MLMKVANFFTILLSIFAINAASQLPQSEDLESRQEALTNSATLSRATADLLNKDYLRNLTDLVNTRWFFRKVANISEASGNTVLYVSAVLPAVAAAIRPTDPSMADTITACGIVALGVHVMLIGIAKCSAREVGEREANLASLLGRPIPSLIPQITDDGATNRV